MRKKYIFGKNILRGISICFLPLFLLLSSCNVPIDDKDKKETKYDLNGIFEKSDYLTVSGSDIVDQDGNDVNLHGVNAGGYLVTEYWMCAAALSRGSTHHLALTNKLTERFGKEKTLELWKYYRDNFWGEQDFLNIKSMGLNVIRLPFSYMSIDPEFNNVPAKEGQEYNFDVLDQFISDAARHGIYVILDLHGAYGSQNGQDHSGETINDVNDVDFFSNETKINKTIHLWEEVTKHYKDCYSIAAFDLLNEPGEKGGSTNKKHWDVYDRMYKAIRKIDERRPIIFESCWEGNNLPQPTEYNWDNAIYSFHHYTGTSDYNSHINSFIDKLNSIERMGFNVPLYMGEFSCYSNSTSWSSTLSLLNANRWHWTSWTYKLNTSDGDRYGGWGIYYSHSERANVDIDDFETIKEKWYTIDTNYDDVTLMEFSDRSTLESIIRNNS